MKSKKIYFLLVFLVLLFTRSTGIAETVDHSEPKIALAYVEAQRKGLPDPELFSHFIYAFCEFNENNDGVIVPNIEKLKLLVALKEKNPDLKVILGIGGYKKEGFSEMCQDKKRRKSFIDQCFNLINTLNLDGIDLDWEFPGTTAGGHTASKKDSKNYGLLVKELRQKLGNDKWISFYSNNSGKWIDFNRMLPYVNYVNVSGYNLSLGSKGAFLHQSNLYPSEKCGNWCIAKSIARHIELGVPREKILLGIPFFARGIDPFPSFTEAYGIDNYTDTCELKWDEKAQAPYYSDRNNNLVAGFDNEESIKAKCSFIRKNGLAGGFIWHYDADYSDHRLAKAINKGLLVNP